MHAAEFEDALGTSVSEDASDSTDGRQVSTKYIDVPGAGKVHIGKAINMAMQGFGQNETAIVPGKLEPGRVARTRDQVKAGTSNTRVPDDVPASGVVAHEDPVLFLVIKRGVLVPCVVLPEDFSTTTKKNISGLSKEDFEASGSSLTGRILNLKANDDVSISWVVGVGYGGHVTVATSRACTLVPETTFVPASKTTTWIFDIKALRDASELLLGNMGEKTDFVTIESTVIPYQTSAGEDIVLPSGVSPLSMATVQRSKGTHTCGVSGCGQRVLTRDLRHHAGYHILVEDPKKVPDDVDLCGLCGRFPQQQFSSEPSTTSCASWLEKSSSKTYKPRTNCAVYGNNITYSQKAASKSVKSAPSSNVIMECPACPKKPMPFYAWKYNMPRHWAKYHESITMPHEFKQALVLHKNELLWLRKFKTSANATRVRKPLPSSSQTGGAAARSSLAGVQSSGAQGGEPGCAGS